jgi:hypothetical protein
MRASAPMNSSDTRNPMSVAMEKSPLMARSESPFVAS